MEEINSHVYLLTAQHMPKGFYQNPMASFFEWLSSMGIGLFNQYDTANWLAERINRGFYESQGEILQEFMDAYNDKPEMRFMVHAIDFDYAPVDEPLISYLSQLQELVQLKTIYQNKIHPFLCIDPRREQGAKLQKFAETYLEGGFAGLTMYPSLGFSPASEALDEVYYYAQKNKVSIVTHVDCFDCFRLSEETNSSPKTFQAVLERFPDLKVCFTFLPHERVSWFDGILTVPERYWGGESLLSKWLHDIQNLVLSYKDVFVDFSALDKPLDFDRYDRLLRGSDYRIEAKQKHKKNSLIPSKHKSSWVSEKGKDFTPFHEKSSAATFLSNSIKPKASDDKLE